MTDSKSALIPLLRKQRGAIELALPSSVNIDRFMRCAETSIQTNQWLADCTPRSVLQSFTESAQLGLVVDSTLGQAYVVPFKDKRGVKHAQLIVGYRGWMELARRAGGALKFEPRVVHANDYFQFEYGLEPFLRHRPAEAEGEDPGPLTFVYLIVHMKDTDPVFFVMSKAQVDAHRERSKSKNNGPWVTDYEPMALKTVIRDSIKYLPVSVDLLYAAVQDERRDYGLSDPRDAQVLGVRTTRDASDALDDLLGPEPDARDMEAWGDPEGAEAAGAAKKPKSGASAKSPAGSAGDAPEKDLPF